MSEKDYDNLIYIGRFQPLHLGHQSVIDTALENSKRVDILIGSSNRPRSDSNPWTYEERENMIRMSYPDEFGVTLFTHPLPDADYNDIEWFAGVQKAVAEINADPDAKIGLVGFEKDSSSYYLHKFPQWELFLIDEQWSTVSATNIRNNYFQRAPRLPDHLCSAGVVDFLKSFMLTNAFKYVLNEVEGLAAHHAQWPPNLPYPIQTVTVDSVCTQSGHILLVTRDKAPGVGLLALPGGHVISKYGDSFDNAIKELIEEAQPMDQLGEERGKPIPKGRLRSCFTGYEKRYDAPNRDPRGYYLTTAFRFVFPDGPLWKVSGDIERGDGDEIADAAWYPIGSLSPEYMFADHYYIIQQMLNQTGGR